MSQLICHYCGHHDPAATLGVRCPADGSVLVPAPEHEKAPEDSLLGRMIGGKYAVIGLIGQGAMGAVYKAMQEPVGREVAIKVIRNARGEQVEELRSRFLREAKVAASLSNPSAVTLFDYGAEKDGILYMVMELIRGRTMGAALAAEGPFAPARIVPIACQVLHALSEAHGLGLVHRDIKPDNIMLVRGPWGGDLAKVLDFGIAKVLQANDDAVFQTRAGLVLGTPLYMAPEQATARELDGRSDLYAVGVTLFQMLTGKLPFTGATPFDVLLAHRDDPIPPFPDSPEVPTELQDVIFQSLQKNPADRFPSAEAMAQALLSAVPGVQLPPQQLAGAASVRTAAAPPSPSIHYLRTQCTAPVQASAAQAPAPSSPSSPSSPSAAAAAGVRELAEAPTPVPPAPTPGSAPASPAAPAAAVQATPPADFVPFSAGRPAPAASRAAAQAASSAPAQAPKRGGATVALVLGGLGLLLLLVAAGGFFAWRSLRNGGAAGPLGALMAKVTGRTDGPAATTGTGGVADDPDEAAAPTADAPANDAPANDAPNDTVAAAGGDPAPTGATATADAADSGVQPPSDDADSAAAGDAAPGDAVAANDAPSAPAADTAPPAAGDAAPPEPERLLFEDAFTRASGAAVGQGWSEFQLRGKAGRLSHRAGTGDWVIRSNTLSIWTQGSLGEVQDFVATPEAYVVEGSRVEFELRGSLPDSNAFFALWVADPAELKAGLLAPGAMGAALVSDKGAPSASLVAGGAVLAQPAAVPTQVKPNAFVRCLLTVQGGRMTWQVGDHEPVVTALDQPLAPGERRRLILGVRASTRAWQKIDLRAMKIYGR